MKAGLARFYGFAVVAVFATACTPTSESNGAATTTTFAAWATPEELGAAMVEQGSVDSSWALLGDPCAAEFFFANVDERDVRDAGLKRQSDVPSFLNGLQYKPDLQFVMLSAFASCAEDASVARSAFPTLTHEFNEVSQSHLECIGKDLRQQPAALEWAAGLGPEDVSPATWDHLFWSANFCLGPQRMGEVFNADLQRSYTLEASTCMAAEASSVQDVGLVLRASALNEDPTPAAVTATAKLMRACLDPAPFGAEVAGWLTSDPADHECLGTAILDMMASGVDFDPGFQQASRKVELRTYEAVFSCVAPSAFFEAAFGVEYSEETRLCLNDSLPGDAIAFDIIEGRTIHLSNSLYRCLSEEEIILMSEANTTGEFLF